MDRTVGTMNVVLVVNTGSDVPVEGRRPLGNGGWGRRRSR